MSKAVWERYIVRASSAARMVSTAMPLRVRFAALYLLLGVLWLANASTIAKAFERCLGVDCFMSDIECRQSLGFTVIGAMSLFLLRGYWRRLSQSREAAAGDHDHLPPEGPALEPGRYEFDLLLVCSSSGSFVMIWIQGFIYRLFSPVIGSPGAVIGNHLIKLGCLGTAYASCLLIIPCIMLRLRMFYMEMDKGATAA